MKVSRTSEVHNDCVVLNKYKGTDAATIVRFVKLLKVNMYT
jgi:hypothetical protein